MDFNIENLNLLLEKLHLENDINSADIPCLDLYMDQVITLFDDKLSELKRNEDDKILTKTMINNYTKAKILMPPNKKKYSKKHIILLILIYYLKQSLSINDINILFNDIVTNLSSDNQDNLDIEKIYDLFLDIKKSEAKKMNTELLDKITLIENKTKDLNVNNNDFFKMFISVLIFVNQANTYKRLAEKIVDDFFSNL